MTEFEKRLGKLAEEINQEHQAFRRAFKATFRSALRAGDLLNEAKAQAGHGNWTAWVEENCEFSDRTARDYMRLANNRDKVEEMLGKTAESADLSIKEVLRELSAPKEYVLTDSIPITRERVEGPLRWAGVEAGEEPTEEENRAPGVEAGQDYAKRVAAFKKAHEDAEERHRQEQRKRHREMFLYVDADLSKARRAIKSALEKIKDGDIPFDDEEVEFLERQNEAVQGISRLFGAALTGDSGTDWDAELYELEQRRQWGPEWEAED